MFLADVILIALVGLFVLFGLFFGLVHTLGSLVGSFLGIVLATRLVDPVLDKIGFVFGGGGVAKVIVFIVLFLLISRLTGLLFWIVEKVFGILSVIPFAKSINRLLGGVLGFIEGVIFVGIGTYFALQYLPDGATKAALEASSIAGYLVTTMTLLQALVPENMRLLK